MVTDNFKIMGRSQIFLKRVLADKKLLKIHDRITNSEKKGFFLRMRKLTSVF